MVNQVTDKLNSNPAAQPDGSVMTEKIFEAEAAGTTQATGTALSATEGDVIIVTNNTAANGVVLPANAKGKKVTIIGALNAVALVYPPVGGSINYGSANAAVSLAARIPGVFIAIDELNWICVTDTDSA